jgi:hypothetical protein
VTDEDARNALDALIRERGEDYAGLSRLIGRNPAYIQQDVKRGSPRRLVEGDRRTLARYFGVPESLLGGPPEQETRIAPARDPGARRNADLIAVPRLTVGASAGPGALPSDERADAQMLFAPSLLRELGAGRPSALSLIRVAGDSMQPTLGSGDDILIDRDDGAQRLRDGIYVLRIGDALIVKRVALKPDGGVAIRSDNPLSPDIPDVDPAVLVVIGRVIWAGRRLG